MKGLLLTPGGLCGFCITRQFKWKPRNEDRKEVSRGHSRYGNEPTKRVGGLTTTEGLNLLIKGSTLKCVKGKINRKTGRTIK
jgi:hypothetical protein